jgi:hypothetical protein
MIDVNVNLYQKHLNVEDLEHQINEITVTIQYIKENLIVGLVISPKDPQEALSNFREDFSELIYLVEKRFKYQLMLSAVKDKEE